MQKVNSLHALAPIKSRGIEQAGRFISTGGGHDDRVVEFLNNAFEQAVIIDPARFIAESRCRST